ncbi:DUF6941 family protein [Actinacidiphila rubida]
MRASMMLCDSAESISDGKLNIYGAGWSVVSSPTPPCSVVIKLEVPWTMRNVPLRLALDLVDADGRKLGGVTGENDGVNPVPTAVPGVPLDSSLVVPVPSFPLAPGRYAWQLEINTEVPDGGYLGFTVR